VSSTADFAPRSAQPTTVIYPDNSPYLGSTSTMDSGLGIGKLVSGNGRIGRLEWVLTVLGIWLFLIVTWGIVIAVDAPGVTIVLGLASLILSVVVATCAGVKRLHDFNQSGWLYLLMLIPFAGFIMLLVLLIVGPTPGQNQFGSENSGSIIR